MLAPHAGLCDVRHERAAAGAGLRGRAADGGLSRWTSPPCWPRLPSTSPAITYLAYPNNPTATLWDEADVQAHHRRSGRSVRRHRGGRTRPTSPLPAAPGWTRMRAQPAAQQPCAADAHARASSAWPVCAWATCWGQPALVAEIDKVRPPYNVSVLNCEAALFALEHADVFAAQAQRAARPAHRPDGSPAGHARQVREGLALRGQHGAAARARCRPHPGAA